MSVKQIGFVVGVIACLMSGVTAAVETKGPFRDPAHYTAGWTSAHHAVVRGENCLVFLFGLGSDNSVRCFHPATGEFTYLTPDTEAGDGSIDGGGINDRDNQLHIHIPGSGLFITGGAYLKGKPYKWGYFDYSLGEWTHRGDGNTGEGLIEWGDYQTFNAAYAWSKKHNFGVFINGESGGGTKRQIVEVTPDGDGTYSTRLLEAQGPYSCVRMRNSAVAVGDWLYLYGGICKRDGQMVDVADWRRFNLVTHKWQQLPDAPHARRLPQVTYDQVTHDIVVFGGGENKYTPSNTVMTWNVDTQGPWQDRTEEVGMRDVKLPWGAYDPETGFHCYRGGSWPSIKYGSDRVFCMRFAEPGDVVEPAPEPTPDPEPTLEQRVDTLEQRVDEIELKLDDTVSETTPSDDPTAEPEPEPAPDPTTDTAAIVPNVITRTLPAIRDRLSPVNGAKHMRLTEATTGDRRLYIISGDWGFADPYAQSARQDTFAYDIFADKWERVVPYCLPDGRTPFAPDEVVQAWDTKRNVLWLGPGVHYGNKETRCDGNTLNWMERLDPATKTWSEPEQGEKPAYLSAYRTATRGVYDEPTDSVIMLHDKHVAIWHVDTKQWETRDHSPVGFFSESQEAQVGRWIYAVEEKAYELYRYHIDTQEFQALGPLPDSLRDGDHDDHGRVYISAQGPYIALYQEVDADMNIQSDMYLLDTRNMTYTPVELTDGARGNTMAWHSSGWVMLFGGTIGYDCCQNPMKHFYLIDLRQFGGTGEDLSDG